MNAMNFRALGFYSTSYPFHPSLRFLCIMPYRPKNVVVYTQTASVVTKASVERSRVGIYLWYNYTRLYRSPVALPVAPRQGECLVSAGTSGPSGRIAVFSPFPYAAVQQSWPRTTTTSSAASAHGHSPDPLLVSQALLVSESAGAPLQCRCRCFYV